MKLACPAYTFPMEITGERVSVLTVEAPALFRNILLDLSNQMNGQAGELVLSEEYCPIPIAKTVCLMQDPLHPDFSSRKILNAIYQAFAANAAGESLFLETQGIRTALAGYIWRLAESTDIPVTFQPEADITALLKAVDLRPTYADLPPAEALLAYMDILSELRAAKLFVFVHLKAYFTTKELEALYADFHYRAYNVLLLESSDCPSLRHLENTILLDQDMCEVINQNTY